MKLNKSKIFMSAMLTLIGSSMVGSIAGTVAWYQYSTRASASYVGASASVTELLEVRVGSEGDWYTNITSTQVIDYLKAQTRYEGKQDKVSSLAPVTAGNQKKDEAIARFYESPSYLVSGEYSKWTEAETTDYVSFPLQFRLKKVDGASTETLLSKDLFLLDLLLQEDTSNADGKEDISDALRVQLHNATGNKDFLLAKTNADTVTTGKLDLDGKDGIDQASTRGTAYSFETKTDYVYGTADSKEEAYALSDLAPTDTNGVLTSGTAIGTIPADGTLTLDVTIFLEGWQKLGEGEGASSIWDAAKYVGSKFDVGMTFAVSKN